MVDAVQDMCGLWSDEARLKNYTSYHLCISAKINGFILKSNCKEQFLMYKMVIIHPVTFF